MNNTKDCTISNLEQPRMCSWLSGDKSNKNLKDELEKCKTELVESDEELEIENILDQIELEDNKIKINILDSNPIKIITPKFHINKNLVPKDNDQETTYLGNNTKQDNSQEETKGEQDKYVANKHVMEAGAGQDYTDEEEEETDDNCQKELDVDDLGKNGEEEDFFIYLDNSVNPDFPVWVGGNKYGDLENDAVLVDSGKTNVIFYGSVNNICKNNIKLWYNYYYEFEHNVSLIYDKIKRGSTVKIPEIIPNPVKMLDITFQILHLTDECPILDLFPEEYAQDLQDRCYNINCNKYFPLFYKKINLNNRILTHIWLKKYRNINLYDIATRIVSSMPLLDPYIILEVTKNSNMLNRYNIECRKYLPKFYYTCLDSEQRKELLLKISNRYFCNSKELQMFPLSVLRAS